MKKKIYIVFLACSLLATGLWTWRYRSLNAYYSSMTNRSKEVFSMREIIPFEADFLTDDIQAAGCSIRVDDFEIVDFDSYSNQNSLIETTHKPEKLALVYVTLFNEGSDATNVLLTAFRLHGLDNYVGMSWDVLLATNPVLEGNYDIYLPPDTECGLIIPFELHSSLFGGDTWRNLDSYEFFFHVTSYPTEKDIQVQ